MGAPGLPDFDPNPTGQKLPGQGFLDTNIGQWYINQFLGGNLGAIESGFPANDPVIGAAGSTQGLYDQSMATGVTPEVLQSYYASSGSGAFAGPSGGIPGGVYRTPSGNWDVSQQTQDPGWGQDYYNKDISQEYNPAPGQPTYPQAPAGENPSTGSGGVLSSGGVPPYTGPGPSGGWSNSELQQLWPWLRSLFPGMTQDTSKGATGNASDIISQMAGVFGSDAPNADWADWFGSALNLLFGARGEEIPRYAESEDLMRAMVNQAGQGYSSQLSDALAGRAYGLTSPGSLDALRSMMERRDNESVAAQTMMNTQRARDMGMFGQGAAGMDVVSQISNLANQSLLAANRQRQLDLENMLMQRYGVSGDILGKTASTEQQLRVAPQAALAGLLREYPSEIMPAIIDVMLGQAGAQRGLDWATRGGSFWEDTGQDLFSTLIGSAGKAGGFGKLFDIFG